MLKKKRIVIREVDERGEVAEIAITESPILHVLEKLQGGELKDNSKIDYLVKAKIEGITTTKKALNIDGEEFIFWISTSSQMKKNDAFYIKKDKASLVSNVERLLSTEKIEKFKNMEVSINKDIIGRLSLGFSDSWKTKIKPNVIIVEDVSYVVNKNITVFNENNELENRNDYPIQVTAFDGCGIAGNEIFKRIANDLKIVGYTPSWCAIRMPKMCVKGLLTNVDFIRFFNDTYTHDTDFFKKIGENFYIKDVFGQFQKVDDNTIIINESMSKWSKFYNSMDEYNKLVDVEYRDLLECLYITKVGKGKVEEYTNTSYQSLLATTITKKSLEQMTEKQVEFYERCLDFDRVSILELLKLQVLDEDDEDVKTTSSKIQTLLSLNFEKFIKMGWVKKEIIKTLDKKIRQLATGRFLVEGNFKTMVSDPISFMNYCMTRELVPNLGSREFYVNGEVGKEIGAVRYPVASPYEITREMLVDNELLDKYCNYNGELIVFNVAGCDALIKSGADFDSDILQVIYNKEFISNIIEPKDGRIFYNIESEEAPTVKLPYTSTNRFQQNIKFAGNAIGSIAVLGSSIMDRCLQPAWIDVNGEIKTYFNFFETIRDKEMIRKYIKDNNLQLIEDVLSEEEQKRYYQKMFEERVKDINLVVRESMIAIDSPKTGIKANKDILKTLKQTYRKPFFFQYLPDKDYKKEDCINLKSVMSFFEVYIYKRLISKFKTMYNYNIRADVTNNDLLIAMKGISYIQTDKEEVEAVKDEIIKIAKHYNREKRFIDNNGKESSYNNGFVQVKKLTGEDKKNMKRNLRLITNLDLDESLSKYDKQDISQAIFEIATQNSHIDFIFNFCWEYVLFCINLEEHSMSQLFKNPQGEFQGFFGRYNITTRSITTGIIEEKYLKKKNFENRIILEKASFRIRINTEIDLKGAEIEIKDANIILNGDVVGSIFLDSLTKANISIADIQGKQTINVYIPNKKSAKVILK
ncbi:hypothetical protein P7A62_00645 [Clostridium perfringens]|nr:hypothetical protein [Clostridium perfringens]